MTDSDKIDLTKGYSIHNFVFSSGDELKQHVSPEMPFIFDGMALGICLRGSATVSINYHIYKLKPQELITVMPKQLFQNLQFTEDFLIEILFLSSSFLQELPLPKDYDVLKHIYDEPCFLADDNIVADLLELHSMVSKYSHSDNHYRQQMTEALIFTLILRIASEYRLKVSDISIRKKSREDFITQRFFNLLSDHYLRERDVAYYAGKLCITVKYLTKIIKKVTGRTASEWISISTVVEIKQRLRNSDSPIFLLAEELGFSDASVFSRYFRRHTGMTPLEYRNLKFTSTSDKRIRNS